MDNKEQKELIDKYLAGECSDEEKVVIESWYLVYTEKQEDNGGEFEYQSTEDKIWSSIEQRNRFKIISLWPHMIAAALLILITFVIFFIPRKTDVRQVAETKSMDVSPGGNKAVLILANGKKVILTDAQNGVLANEGSVQIKKDKDGAIKYQIAESNGSVMETEYNTISTPKGGKYIITLADGTTVTLDALSSIRFPTAFSGNEREVTTTGQVYFEVTHNPEKPFRVNTKTQTIEVLGTNFNINAYDSESTLKTTLLKGSVKVTQNGSSVLLKPKQQSQIGLNNKISVKDCDIEEVIAWKNGLFQFNNADIKSVMDQLARWYDVEVTYEGDIPDRRFSGKIYKNVSISQVLNILSFSKVHFKIEGKKIFVTR